MKRSKGRKTPHHSIEQCRQRASRRAAPRGSAPEYRANFLWPHDDGSVEEAGYEFANARTEAYRAEWWNILRRRIAAQNAGGEH